MPINSIFQANNRGIRHLLIVVASLLLAFWGSITLDILGFAIPLLRQVTGFFLLTFVPGILILRIFRIRHFGVARTTVYAAGFSLAALMFIGFFVNIAYPSFGIVHPLSLWPLVATISAFIALLCSFAWIRGRDFTAPILVDFREILSPPVLVLSLLPFGAIAGTYLMNHYGVNTVQMILLPTIALVPVVIIYTRSIPEKYYPYAVFSVAITLLYHTALISTYIWGWDIQYEYYLTSGVIQNSIWDFTDYSNCNAMLSLMTLAPIYSILLGLEAGWVFKVIYPFLFALVPLGLYVVFRKQVNEKISFLACFFFMSVFVFYTEMISLARQEVAELFLVLILLSMIDRGLSNQQRSIFLLTFTASLIVSHYGLSYIFMLLLLTALAIVTIEYHVGILDRINWFLDRVQKQTGHFTGLMLQKADFKLSIMPLSFIIWCGLFLLAWYIYMASSSPFESIVQLAHLLLKDILTDLLNPNVTQGIAIIVNEAATPLREVTKYLHLLMIIFIFIGFIITTLTRLRWAKFDSRYLLLSCGALGICIGGVALPYFASALNTTRLYQISLILLAPFGIIGGITLISRLRNFSESRDPSLHIIALFLGAFLLFNCGWAFEVDHEVSSFAINNSIDSPVITEQEIYGAVWLTDTKDDRPVVADTYRVLLLSSFAEVLACHDIQTVVPGDVDYYTFIGKHNILQDRIAVLHMTGVVSSIQFIGITGLHEGKNGIYSNGGSRIYYPNLSKVPPQKEPY